jgi:hypothetical protein
MAGRKREIVIVRCLQCGVEIVGVLRDGQVYAVNVAKPDAMRTIDGYCAAHARLTIPMARVV